MTSLRVCSYILGKWHQNLDEHNTKRLSHLVLVNRCRINFLQENTDKLVYLMSITEQTFSWVQIVVLTWSSGKEKTLFREKFTSGFVTPLSTSFLTELSVFKLFEHRARALNAKLPGARQASVLSLALCVCDHLPELLGYFGPLIGRVLFQDCLKWQRHFRKDTIVFGLLGKYPNFCM